MMKKINAWTIAVLIPMTLLAGCGEKTPESDEEFLSKVRETAKDPKVGGDGKGTLVPDAATPPKIELEVEEFDMGYVPIDKPTIKEMKIYNRGDNVLTIMKIDTTCGCTTAKMNKKDIPPHGVGILSIKLDPLRFRSFSSRKILTITSSDPVNMKVELPVTAKIKGEVIFSEKTMNFGVIKENTAAELTIRLTQTQSEEPVTVQEIIFPKEDQNILPLR